MSINPFALISAMQGRKYRPLRPEKLLLELGLPATDLDELETLLGLLESGGVLRRGSDGAVTLLGGKNLVMGTIELNRRGFGFVRQEEPGSQDIHVSADALGATLHGDLVLVERSKGKRYRGRLPSGRVVMIVKRAHQRVVGTYDRWRGRGFVRPEGVALQREIGISEGHRSGAQPGQKVVVQLGARSDVLTGHIESVLGEADDPGVDLRVILEQFDLPREFPPETLEEARQLARRSPHTALDGRTDLREDLIVTIDPEDAQDFDDAISLVHDRQGWELGVHIADVSHFVRPGSAIWDEAVRRGTSVYLPGHTIHMLPEELSAGRCSLRPEEDHFTKSVFMRFDREGGVRKVRLERSVIRSKARLNYQQASRAIAGHVTGVSEEVTTLLHEANRLAKALNAVRLKRGALELELPELKVKLDDLGLVKEVLVPERLDSHRLIEECMIAANEAVARTLLSKGLPVVSRVHEEPNEESLRDLFQFARSLGLSAGKDYSRRMVQRLLDAVRGTEIEYAVHMVALRSLTQAYYSSRTRGHYALAATDYCHFTSPIRRLPDLLVHTVLDEGFFRARDGKFDPDFWAERLENWSVQASHLERRAESAERELIQIKLLRHLKQHVGQTMMGTVVGVLEFGAFVELDQVPMEGLIRVRDLSDDYYDHSSEGHTLTGRRHGKRIRLGDRIKVTIRQVDMDRRELDLVPARR